MRPSFQFYPGDWQSNSNLRRCSFEERGIWLEVICLLHDQEEYGISRWPLKEIAQAVGCQLARLKGLVDKGILKGVDGDAVCPALIYIPRSGRKSGPPVTLIGEQMGPLWYSSRMVKDEYKRVLRGELGGAPKDAPKPPLDAAPIPTPDDSPFSCAQASRAAPSSPSPSSSPKEKQKRSSATPPYDPLPDLKAGGVSDQIASDWLAVRKAKKAAVTVTALQEIIAEAAKAGVTLERALTMCCARGWAGFKAKWLDGDDSSDGLPPKKDWQ